MARTVPFVGSLIQGVSAILFVFILAVHYARHRTMAVFSANHANLRWLVPVLKVIGGILLILFATVLFLTVIPSSVNGDYITGGC